MTPITQQFQPDPAGTIIIPYDWMYEQQPFRNINANTLATTLAVEAFRFGDIHPSRHDFFNRQIIIDICDVFGFAAHEIEERGYQWQLEVRMKPVGSDNIFTEAYSGMDVTSKFINSTRNALLGDEKVSTEINHMVWNLRICKVGGLAAAITALPLAGLAAWFGWSKNPFCTPEVMSGGLSVPYHLCLTGFGLFPAGTLVLEGGLFFGMYDFAKRKAAEHGFKTLQPLVAPVVRDHWVGLSRGHTIEPSAFESPFYELYQGSVATGGGLAERFAGEYRIPCSDAGSLNIEAEVAYYTQRKIRNVKAGGGFVLEATSANPVLEGTVVRLRAVPLNL